MGMPVHGRVPSERLARRASRNIKGGRVVASPGGLRDRIQGNVDLGTPCLETGEQFLFRRGAGVDAT